MRRLSQRRARRAWKGRGRCSTRVRSPLRRRRYRGRAVGRSEAPGEQAEQGNGEGHKHRGRDAVTPCVSAHLPRRRELGQLGLREAGVERVDEELRVEAEEVGVDAKKTL